MELLSIMKNRRSIRQYTDEAIPKEHLKKIVQAGLLAPSSKNIRPVEMIVVEDRKMLEKLSKSKQSGSAMLSNATCAIVVIADTSQADAWVEDCSLAMGYMMLMAENLGIGACWVQERLRQTSQGSKASEYVKEILNIPAHYEVEAILSLGMPAQSLPPQQWDEDKQKIHFETF